VVVSLVRATAIILRRLATANGISLERRRGLGNKRGGEIHSDLHSTKRETGSLGARGDFCFKDIDRGSIHI